MFASSTIIITYLDAQATTYAEKRGHAEKTLVKHYRRLIIYITLSFAREDADGRHHHAHYFQQHYFISSSFKENTFALFASTLSRAFVATYAKHFHIIIIIIITTTSFAVRCAFIETQKTFHGRISICECFTIIDGEHYI